MPTTNRRYIYTWANSALPYTTLWLSLRYYCEYVQRRNRELCVQYTHQRRL